MLTLAVLVTLAKHYFCQIVGIKLGYSHLKFGWDSLSSLEIMEGDY